MKPTPTRGGPAVKLVAIYVALIFAFTAMGMALAPSEAQVGAARPASAIPLHLAELLGFGVLLGAMSAVLYGRRGLPMMLLAPFLVALLDLDHLPAYIGLAQPIRPAHSFVFILVALVCAAIVLRRLDLELILVSSFTGHLGVDTGIFAPFAPISFAYVELDPYKVPLLLLSVISAFLAGYAWRRRNSDEAPR